MFKYVPIKWLSECHSMRDGKKIYFTEKETRAWHAESTYGRLVSISQKYHPVYCTKRKINKTWRKYAEIKLYLLVGKITLIHAGLEQEIRATLVGEFGHPYEKKDSKEFNDSGFPLRKMFKEIVNKSSMEDLDKQKITSWCEEFEKLSKDRNDAVKAAYSFNEGEHKITKINMVNFRGRSQRKEAPDDIFGWMSDVPFDQLEEIAKKSDKLRRELFEINWHLFRKKMQLSKWYW